MEAVVFVGIQAVGKSTFYQRCFFHTHVRINLDMLKTRYRESVLFQACLLAKQPLVVDNTNVTLAERARYLGPAREHGFRTCGYFFPAPVREAIARNRQREGRAVIPVPGILGTNKRLQPPRREEGFDALYLVRIAPAGEIGGVGEFVVEEA